VRTPRELLVPNAANDAHLLVEAGDASYRALDLLALGAPARLLLEKQSFRLESSICSCGARGPVRCTVSLSLSLPLRFRGSALRALSSRFRCGFFGNDIASWRRHTK
jgi:hypothetical protein